VITRYPLAFVATVLTDADALGVCPAARKHGVWPETVYRWTHRRWRENRPWPIPEDIAADEAYRAATADHRAAHAAALARTRQQTYLRRGAPLHVPAHGTTRRIRALHALGWTGADLGARLGVSLYRVSQLAVEKSPTVHPDTAAAVRRLYAALSMTVPDHHPAWLLARTRRTAAAKGWAVPLLWDDHALDDPAGRPSRAQRAA
jgi:transposase-like protein